MAEVVVVANLKAQPGQEDAAKEALTGLVEPTQNEDGCLFYALHQAAEDPTRFVTVERWKDPSDLEAHMGSDHIAAVLAKADELLAEQPDIVVLNAIPAGDPKLGSLAEAMA